MFSKGSFTDKPMMIDTANNEGWNFVLILKLADLNTDLLVSPVRWNKLINNLFDEDVAGRILEMYACPCQDETNKDCECRTVADSFLTDYTWYCNIRYAMTEGK